MSKKINELKPCPYCGRFPKIKVMTIPEKKCIIECRGLFKLHCKVETPAARNKIDFTVEEAKRVWNSLVEDRR